MFPLHRSRPRALRLHTTLLAFGWTLLPLNLPAQERASTPNPSATGVVDVSAPPASSALDPGPTNTFHLEDDLTLGPGDWTAALANYPAEFSPTGHYRFQTGWVPPLVAVFGPGDGGIGVRGFNDDGAFQGSYPLTFLQRPVDGLVPDTYYLVTFERVQIGTVSAILFGTGNFTFGPNPLRIYGRVEVAASTQEPTIVERFEPGYGRAYRELSVREHKTYVPPVPDSPDPALHFGGLSGTAAARLGLLAVQLGPDEIPILDTYDSVELPGTDRPLCVKTDGMGRCWLVVGNELNLDGRTDVFYRHIAVTLRPVRQPRPLARLSLVEAPAAPGQPLSVRYTLLNAQDQLLGLSFSSAQVALVQVRDSSGVVVATNDLLGLNLPVTPSYVLAPGERFAFEASVPTDALLPGQSYTVEALLIGYGQYAKRVALQLSPSE